MREIDHQDKFYFFCLGQLELFREMWKHKGYCICVRVCVCVNQDLCFVDGKGAIDQGWNVHLGVIKLQLIFKFHWNGRDKLGRQYYI